MLPTADAVHDRRRLGVDVLDVVDIAERAAMAALHADDVLDSRREDRRMPTSTVRGNFARIAVFASVIVGCGPGASEVAVEARPPRVEVVPETGPSGKPQLDLSAVLDGDTIVATVTVRMKCRSDTPGDTWKPCTPKGYRGARVEFICFVGAWYPGKGLRADLTTDDEGRAVFQLSRVERSTALRTAHIVRVELTRDAAHSDSGSTSAEDEPTYVDVDAAASPTIKAIADMVAKEAADEKKREDAELDDIAGSRREVALTKLATIEKGLGKLVGAKWTDAEMSSFQEILAQYEDMEKLVSRYHDKFTAADLTRAEAVRTKIDGTGSLRAGYEKKLAGKMHDDDVKHLTAVEKALASIKEPWTDERVEALRAADELAATIKGADFSDAQAARLKAARAKLASLEAAYADVASAETAQRALAAGRKYIFGAVRSPSTLKFVTDEVVLACPGGFITRHVFDSQNGFGATIRSVWSVKLDVKHGRIDHSDCINDSMGILCVDSSTSCSTFRLD
ncbi:MAG: hypothetical protein ACHREM_18970 [Polyangiales bacterium]